MNELLIRISDLFRKYGVKSITMDDVANNLGISKKTLYQYFKNKADLVNITAQFEIKLEFEEIYNLQNSYENALEQLIAISNQLVKKSCQISSSLLFSLNKYYPVILKEIMSKRKAFITNFLMNNFNLGIKQGVYRQNLNADLIQAFYIYLFDQRCIEIYSDWLNEDFDNRFNDLILYHLRALVNPKEIDRIEKKINLTR